MKYLKKYYKLFEDFNEIHEICRKYRIQNYTINSDGSIDVEGNANLSRGILYKIPLRFRNVSGYFSCHHNNLTSLEGCPSRVGGDFYCNNNNLTSLEGSPSSVGGYFSCHNNKLTSLEYSPSRVGGDFDCSYNKLTTLEGFETRIGGDFLCIYNPIYKIWKLFRDTTKIELFNYYDIIQDGVVVMDRLNDFLIEIGKKPVEKVNGYKCI